MTNPNRLAWLDRIEALADACPDAKAELAGGLVRFLEMGDVTLAVPTGVDLDAVEVVRAPGETDAEFEAAKIAYRKLFRNAR